MKALVGAFNQEKALVGAFSVIVQPVVEPMEHYTALSLLTNSEDISMLGRFTIIGPIVSCLGKCAPCKLGIEVRLFTYKQN